jgi:TPP-dependent pyruvate/acetoin dehydrogenase alpha subunit
MTAQELIHFEDRTKTDWESGLSPCLLHLAGGNEDQLLEIFQDVRKGDWIFSTHRNHYHAILAGVPRGEIRSKIDGGDSMFVYSKEHNFFCSAILAGTCGIAAGVAWRILHEKDYRTDAEIFSGCPFHLARFCPKVYCFIGDGGEEQGHFYEAAMFVEANDLPCTFIIEDNNRSVDTPRDVRRGEAKGLEHLFQCVKRYHYEPTYPHAGSGCNFQITFKPEAIERMK